MKNKRLKSRIKKDFLVEFFENITTKQAKWIIVIVGYVVYFNTLFNSFAWDDNIFILGNQLVHRVNIIGIFQENLFNYGAYFRPIAALYFSLIYSLFKTNPFFYHFLQVSIHVANAILLYKLYTRFFKKFSSLFFALTFLTHPLQVESVSFVSYTIGPLFFLLGISAFFVTQDGNLNNRRSLTIFILLFLSALTRELGLLFVLLITIYAFLFRIKNLKFYLTSGALLLVVYFTLRILVVGFYPATNTLVPIAKLSLAQRLFNIPSILLYYFRNFFFPNNLIIDQLWVVYKLNLQNFYLPLFYILIFLLLLLLFGKYLYKKSKHEFRIFIFFLSWLLLGALFLLQIFPLDMTVADRWFYFPIVGLLGIFALGFQEIILKHNIHTKFFYYVALILLICLSVRTIIRNRDWKDSLTLYLHDSLYEANFDLYNNLGAELQKQERYDEAINYFNKSINLFPNELNYSNLGFVYQQINDDQKALEYYKKGLDATTYNVYDNSKHLLSTFMFPIEMYLQKSDYLSAKNLINTAIESYPKNSRLYVYLAYTDYKLKNYNEALTAATTAYSLEPNDITKFVYLKIKSNKPLNIELRSGNSDGEL